MGAQGHPLSRTTTQTFSVQFLSFLCSFQKICGQIIGWHLHLWDWHPNWSGLVWYILDPPLVTIISQNKTCQCFRYVCVVAVFVGGRVVGAVSGADRCRRIRLHLRLQQRPEVRSAGRHDGSCIWWVTLNSVLTMFPLVFDLEAFRLWVYTSTPQPFWDF